MSKPNPWHVIPIGIEDAVSSAVEKSPRIRLPASGRVLDFARNDPLRVLRSHVYPYNHA
jgi:hypothetical protein